MIHFTSRAGSIAGRVILWSSIAVILGGLIWGMIALNGHSSSSNTNAAIGTPPAPTAADHERGGPLTAPVVLIEYSDLQCPACKAYEPIVRQMTDKFGDKLALVYRHFPLRGVHQYADLAVEAAEAANKQGSFWAMHDMMFDNQDTWAASSDATTIFQGYAKQLGLNVDQFKKDMASSAVKDIDNASYDAATKLNLNQTPSFFLNGKYITNPAGADAFATVIQNAIDAKP